jgi:hypothetical protein
MADKVKFEEYMDQQSQYFNYLLFFQREIEVIGVRVTLEEQVIAGTDYTNRVFARMHARQYRLIDPKSNVINQCYTVTCRHSPPLASQMGTG